MIVLFNLWILILQFHQEVCSTCILPSRFQSSVWIDSDKGELMFDTSSMAGWDFHAGGFMYDDWECFYTSTFETKLYLIMIAKQNITWYGKTFTPYLCMELTEISSTSYYYYLLWAEEEKYDFERISTTYSTTIVFDPLQELCLSLNVGSEAAQLPGAGEYHIMIEKGREYEAKQECPSTFFGEYSYTVTDIAASTNYCGTGNEVWDVCTDYEKMTFNYTICDTEIAYSGNGSVFCLLSITTGGYTYHTVYNEDITVDISSQTYRFTCLMSRLKPDGSINVSQTPGGCKTGQTPDNQPKFAYNGSAAGLNISLKPRKLCPKPSTDSRTNRNLSSVAIVGIVIGAVILTIVISLTIVVGLKMKCRQQRRNFGEDKTRNKPSKSNGITEELPVIPDGNTNQSQENERDMTVSYSVKPDINHENGQVYKLSEITNKENIEISSETIIETNQAKEELVDSIEECPFTQSKDEENIEDDAVEDIKRNFENCLNENKSDEIHVTRVANSENILRKDVPHLNSIENIFSEYDAAMTYKIDNYGLSKSDVNLYLQDENRKLEQTKTNPSEFTRDDSDLNMKSESMLSGIKLHKSEGNLADALTNENLKLEPLVISRLKSTSIEWNFTYTSPYALTIEQKQEILERKIKMQKRKKQLERRKREEKENTKRENMIAFEKWKQRKKEEALTHVKSAESGTVVSGKSHRYNIWYPT